ncbi:hypothetical protein K3495_g15327 [Podosphaera aphanis]|nr:hypothetical protein K3495_g15327 [Podosphaera aphanis]
MPEAICRVCAQGWPFKIIEAVGNYAFKLELPKSARIHPVFHVSLLSPVATYPLPGQTSVLPPVLDAEGDDPEYEIEKIIGSHWQNGELHYLVRWKGYGPEDDWSIPANQIEGFKDLVREYHEMNPSKPGPNDSTKKLKANLTKQKPRRSSARLRGGNVRNRLTRV